VDPVRARVGQTATVTVEITGVDEKCRCWPCCDDDGLCPCSGERQGNADPVGICCANQVDMGDCCECSLREKHPASNSSSTAPPTTQPAQASVEAVKATPRRGHKGSRSTHKGSQFKHRASHLRHKSGCRVDLPENLSGIPVFLALIGPGAFVPQETAITWTSKNQKMSTGQPTVYEQTVISTDTNGIASIDVKVLGEEPILVVVIGVDDTPLFTVVQVDINPFQAPPPPPPIGSPVAKLLLSPAKAYRHCDDTITLSALAVDANSAPVANATVAFAAYGDCVPTTKQVSAVTDKSGIAIITMLSSEPGAVSVVAATVNTQGVPVLSQPAHVFFFNERHHADERERKYFGEGYDGEHR